MLRSIKTLSISLGIISFALVPACYADEATSTTIKTDTPVGSASTEVETKSNALGTSTKVKKQASDIYGNTKVRSKTRSASVDGVTETETATDANAAGSASSSSASSTKLNAAGGVTQQKRKVKSVNTPLGSSHKVEDETSATSPFCSTTIKKESQVTTP